MTKGKKKVTNQVVSSDNEVAKLIKIVVIITVLFLVFYIITIFVNKNKDNSSKKEEEKAEIQYDRILIGNLLNQTNDVYYVLVEDTKDTNNSIYEAYLSVYDKLDKANRVYYAALNNPLNAQFLGTESKTDVTDIKDLKLKGTTLLKVEKGKITKAYEGKENLVKFLYELSETKEEEKK